MVVEPRSAVSVWSDGFLCSGAPGAFVVVPGRWSWGCCCCVCVAPAAVPPAIVPPKHGTPHALPQLTRLEKEARFDVKWRHGQRYQNLSRAVELLLMFSVMLALWKAGIAFLEQLAAWTVEHDSLGEQQEEEEAG